MNPEDRTPISAATLASVQDEAHARGNTPEFSSKHETPPKQPEASWFHLLKQALGLKPAPSLRDEIEDALEETEADAEFLPPEKTIMRNVLNLRERRVADVMVPRSEIYATSDDVTLPELLDIFQQAGHSRLPVFHETLDDPQGMIHIRDVFGFLVAANTVSGIDSHKLPLALPLTEAGFLRATLYVPPSTPVLSLLLRMQAERIHMALVINEYGETNGLVTIEDLIECVIGEIDDEHDEGSASMSHAEADGSYRLSARMPINEAAKPFDIQLANEEEAENIDTIGGFVAALAGRVPAKGEIIKGPHGLTFQIIDADPRRIKELRMYRETRAEPNALQGLSS